MALEIGEPILASELPEYTPLVTNEKVAVKAVGEIFSAETKTTEKILQVPPGHKIFINFSIFTGITSGDAGNGTYGKVYTKSQGVETWTEIIFKEDPWNQEVFSYENLTRDFKDLKIFLRAHVPGGLSTAGVRQQIKVYYDLGFTNNVGKQGENIRKMNFGMKSWSTTPFKITLADFNKGLLGYE